jgi:hypothetical protein
MKQLSTKAQRQTAELLDVTVRAVEEVRATAARCGDVVHQAELVDVVLDAIEQQRVQDLAGEAGFR